MHGDLDGFTIGVTADRRSDEQIKMLAGRGATCLHGPALQTLPLLPEAETAEATGQLIATPPDITVLTTGIGVRGWFSSADTRLEGDRLRDAIDRSEVIARGAKARGAAITAGLDISSATVDTFDDIVSALGERCLQGTTVAIQLDGDPECTVIERIESLGATVIPVPVYRWTPPVDSTALVRLVTAVAQHEVDALTFTARPAVENFVRCAREQGVFPAICEATRWTTLVVCVGERTASVVTESGLGRPTFPDRPQLGTMVRHLTEQLYQSATEVDLAGHRVVLRGSELRVGSQDPQILSRREKRLLSILSSRPGVVFSKKNLLSEVWQGNSTDEHVVEVTVGRLRKRLGVAGKGIQTVKRRGYRLSAT